jgi:hypothetical protein
MQFNSPLTLMAGVSGRRGGDFTVGFANTRRSIAAPYRQAVDNKISIRSG